MKQALLALAVFLLPAISQAQENFSYSWFEVGFIGDVDQETPDGHHEGGDGISLKLNFLAGDLFYLTGYADEIESNGSNLDVDRFGLGLGARHEFNERMGLFGTLTYEDFESEITEKNGLGLAVGLRYYLQEDFEAFGGVKYSDYDVVDGLFFNLGGVWSFHKDYALVAEYNRGEFSFDEQGYDLEREDVRLSLRVQF